MIYYAGIGSRDTPQAVLDLMERIAYKLALAGYTLRSGHAPGADMAFERGAATVPKPPELVGEIYLPWPDFNTKDNPVLGLAFKQPNGWARPIAALHHPAWRQCSPAAKNLHARNVHQVLGPYPDSAASRFVVCWTKDAKGEGGTGQALRIARAYHIPVFDLADSEARARLEAFVA